MERQRSLCPDSRRKGMRSRCPCTAPLISCSSPSLSHPYTCMQFPEQMSALDNERATPLHWAASKGNALAARVLVECGTPVLARDSVGRTAAECAAAAKHRWLAHLLTSGRIVKYRPLGPDRSLYGFWAFMIPTIFYSFTALRQLHSSAPLSFSPHPHFPVVFLYWDWVCAGCRGCLVLLRVAHFANRTVQRVRL